MDIEFEDYDYFDYDYGNIQLKIFYIDDKADAEPFYIKNKKEVSELAFAAIKNGIAFDLLEVTAFRFNICGRMASVNIKRDNFDKTLQKCIEVFEEYEEYEKCCEALKIINSDPFIKSETSDT